MKATFTIIMLVASLVSATASVGINASFGVAYDSAGVPVADGTLWALIVDANDDSAFAGGFGEEQTLQQVGANVVFSQGLAISVGTVLGGDIVFAMGGFNGAGLYGPEYSGLAMDQFIVLALGTNGLSPERKFAFYWFPAVTYSPGVNIVGTQVGGINSNVDSALMGSSLMKIPYDFTPSSITVGTAVLGGTLSNSRFTAVNLVPEPSSGIIVSIGLLGLFWRRRK